MSEIATNRLIGRGQTRPHPWSTRFDEYVCWTGLTDRSYFARLLPAMLSKPNLPAPATLWPLFAAKPGQQVECPKSTCLFHAFAQYLTDGFLRTRQFNTPPGPGGRVQPENRKRTTSNHEIDLSTLYGRTEDQTLALRYTRFDDAIRDLRACGATNCLAQRYPVSREWLRAARSAFDARSIDGTVEETVAYIMLTARAPARVAR